MLPAHPVPGKHPLHIRPKALHRMLITFISSHPAACPVHLMTVDRLEQLPLLYQGRDFPQTVVHLVKPGHRTPAMGLCDPDPPCLLQIGMVFFPAVSLRLHGLLQPFQKMLPVMFPCTAVHSAKHHCKTVAGIDRRLLQQLIIGRLQYDLDGL